MAFYKENFKNAKKEVVAGNFVRNKDEGKQPSVTIDLPDNIKTKYTNYCYMI